jgi:mannose-6-phosphate isomerase
MKLIALPPNQPRQFYRGGAVLGEFRAAAADDEYRPEDWIGSTTARNGALHGEGLTTLPDGRLLLDAVRDDPEGWLGAEHARALGADPALLVKLLDAGERLPVHVHPTRAFAQSHLGCRSGKTEAWIVLDARGADARVHLGFTRDIEAGELDRWMAAQDSGSLLASMHALDVRAGDAVLVPAGLPHAISTGIFCLELQEPTDFSMMLEWDGFELDPSAARLGLEADVARECVARAALSPARLESLRSSAVRAGASQRGLEPLLPLDADPFFRAQRVRGALGPVSLEAGFAILVVTAGRGRLDSEHGGALELERGSTALIPHAAGQTILSGQFEAVRCQPPSVAAAIAGGLVGPPPGSSQEPR